MKNIYYLQGDTDTAADITFAQTFVWVRQAKFQRRKWQAQLRLEEAARKGRQDDRRETDHDELA